MRQPSESDKLQGELTDVLRQPPSAAWAITSAQSYTLRTAMRMLQAQIAYRRALATQLVGWPDGLDLVAGEIQRRVDRIRLIVAELRRRGEVVEWEE